MTADTVPPSLRNSPLLHSLRKTVYVVGFFHCNSRSQILTSSPDAIGAWLHTMSAKRDSTAPSVISFMTIPPSGILVDYR